MKWFNRKDKNINTPTSQKKELPDGMWYKTPWGDDSYYNARSMDVYIAKLRKYLREDKKIDLKTIHGFGFKLLILE